MPSEGLDAPVLAKIQGGAFGGGLFLALYADYRIAEERAIFAAPEVTLGWIPPGGIEELVDEIGAGAARHLVLTGERVKAPRALELGLVHRVVPAERLDAAAEQTAAHLAGLPKHGGGRVSSATSATVAAWTARSATPSSSTSSQRTSKPRRRPNRSAASPTLSR